MKVYKGMMYRIIVERACGCRAQQEFKDDVMREPDGEPTYKPCVKHKRGQIGEIIQEILFEVILKEADEHRAKTNIAVAEKNAERVAEAAKPVIGEGAVAETRIKIGNAPNETLTSRPAPPAVRTANLASGSKSGIRRTVTPTRAAKAPIEAGDLGTAVEDVRITKVLVDDPEGGLLGAHDDPTGENP